ncbi:MAG: DUF5385 domain-containing protein [Mycoplasmoidaceae bacterium]|nr:MAG: DUF5385 domain-containing protein [Mycoplasmoidaceae bacterium]
MQTYLPIIILVLVIIFFIIWKKNKKKKETTKIASVRKEKDEVWNTIKMYVRDHEPNSLKGEITDHYVVRRNNIDYVPHHISSFCRRQKRAEIDIRRMQNGKTEYQKPRDLYVVCFQTKDTKTNTFNPPKAFECEVINTRINKKETQSKIVITQPLNFDKEMEWIAPIRSVELKRKQRNDKIAAKEQAKLAKKNERIAAKKQKKNKQENQSTN